MNIKELCPLISVLSGQEQMLSVLLILREICFEQMSEKQNNHCLFIAGLPFSTGTGLSRKPQTIHHSLPLSASPSDHFQGLSVHFYTFARKTPDNNRTLPMLCLMPSNYTLFLFVLIKIPCSRNNILWLFALIITKALLKDVFRLMQERSYLIHYNETTSFAKQRFTCINEKVQSASLNFNFGHCSAYMFTMVGKRNSVLNQNQIQNTEFP